MANIIDRRLNPRDKTLKNRRKFIQRSREQIKRAVKEQIDEGNIADIEDGKVRVRVDGVDEPEFQVDPKTGDKRYVLPGNDQFVVGDKQQKPQGGQSQGGKKGGLGRGEDGFDFILSPDEYLDFIMEDLELPNLVKKKMKDVTQFKPKRTGFTNVGNPSQLDVVRSLKNSLGRRIGLGRPKSEEIEQLEDEIEAAERRGDLAVVADLRIKLDEMQRKMMAVPWIDPFDVRYRNFTPVPQPMTQAVMFCVMDVSGSMGQSEKELAKRFFFLLHMFLRRKYQKVEIVFIKHHEEAFEVTEDDFFHSRESGGTVVSTAIELTKQIIKSRYNLEEWNIYVAQCSDGDNYGDDAAKVEKAMRDVLPLAQYYAYVEIANSFYERQHYSDLWQQYQKFANEFDHLHMKEVSDVSDIWNVFKQLFAKEQVK